MVMMNEKNAILMHFVTILQTDAHHTLTRVSLQFRPNGNIIQHELSANSG